MALRAWVVEGNHPYRVRRWKRVVEGTDPYGCGGGCGRMCSIHPYGRRVLYKIKQNICIYQLCVVYFLGKDGEICAQLTRYLI